MIKKLFTLIFLIFRGAKRFLVWLIHRDPKKIAAFLLLVAVIVAAAKYFIKTVPDYSRPGGYAYVSRSDYARYQKGYCLKEDRILSDEELFRRAILQYMRKDYELQMKKYWFYENMDWTSSAVKPKYFIYKKSEDEIIKLILNKQISGKKRFSIFQERPIALQEIEKYLAIDWKEKTAGFSYPVLLRVPYYRMYHFHIFLNKSFLLNRKQRAFEVNNISATNTEYDADDLEEYKNLIIKHKNHSLRYNRKIDNCGNVDYDVEEIYRLIEPNLGEAG